MGRALMPIEGLFLLPASIPGQIIVKGIRRNSLSIRRFWGRPDTQANAEMKQQQ